MRSKYFLIIGRLKTFLRGLVRPRSADEDLSRRELILNILIIASLVLFSVAFVINLIDWLRGAYNTMPAEEVLVFPLMFIALRYASYKGFVAQVSYFLVSILLLLGFYMSYTWGIDLPSVLLIHALTIVISGVLIRSSFAFWVSAFIVGEMLLIGGLQELGWSLPEAYWREAPWGFTDTIVAGVLFLIIVTVSWLSNRDMEKSLLRARNSEAALKLERDLLEERVLERTNELRQAQLEKMTQAYRFVEFGRLAGGIFHDLMSPLTALSLNIENEDIDRAKHSALRMRELMDLMRRHIANEVAEAEFSVTRSLKDVIKVLNTHARSRDIAITLEGKETKLLGDQAAFTQVFANLISNAIDSYGEIERPEKDIRILVSNEGQHIIVSVEDNGAGMSPELLSKIFEPFFTTKEGGKGLGIGLPLAQRIVEKKFGGRIEVDSEPGRGSCFKIYLKTRGS